MTPPAPNAQPKPPSTPRLGKPILFAGLLGGLLGGVLSFAASRWLVPTVAAKPDAAGSSPTLTEARGVAEAFIGKLQAAKLDEFLQDVKQATPTFTEQEFAAFRKQFEDTRLNYLARNGPPLHEFELIRETALSPSLVRYVYLEKYTRGGVIWNFVLYHGKDQWRLDWVSHTDLSATPLTGL